MNILDYLKTINEAVMEEYPTAFLYEVHSVALQIDEDDSNYYYEGIDVDNTEVIYGLETEDGGKSIIVKQSNDPVEGISMKVIDSPWMQDRPFTPYIPMDSDNAIKLIGEEHITLPGPMFTLRFPLYPGNYEPAYIFGSNKTRYVSVGVYSGTVNTI